MQTKDSGYGVCFRHEVAAGAVAMDNIELFFVHQRFQLTQVAVDDDLTVHAHIEHELSH